MSSATPNLWYAEHRQGREEGVKNRPCAILIATETGSGEIVVIVVPITHTPPSRRNEAIEIPPPTKQRLGLDSERSWVIVNEANRFAWPGPDLHPIDRINPARFDYGVLPPKLFKDIRTRFLESAREQRLHHLTRTE